MLFVEKINKLKQLNKDTKFLLLSAFLIPASTFMLIPFLPIILNTNANMSFKVIGIIMAMMIGINFCGSFIGGFIVRKIGEKEAMVSALFLRVLGFIIFTFSNYHFIPISLSLITIAIGGALYSPAGKSYLIKSISQEERPFFISISSAIFNLGLVIGPLIGGLFILNHTFKVVIFTTLITALILFIHIYFIHSFAKAEEESKKDDSLLSFIVLKRISFIFFFNILSYYFYFFYFTYMGPFIDTYYNARTYSIILVFNSLLVILFQPIFSSYINKIFFDKLVANSFILMGMGFYLISLVKLHFIVLGVIFISFGEIFLFLKMELAMLEKFPNNPAVSFGYFRLAAGAGAALSGITGGYLFDFFQKDIMNINYFWILIMLKCFLGAGILYIRIFKKKNLQPIKL